MTYRAKQQKCLALYVNPLKINQCCPGSVFYQNVCGTEVAFLLSSVSRSAVGVAQIQGETMSAPASASLAVVPGPTSSSAAQQSPPPPSGSSLRALLVGVGLCLAALVIYDNPDLLDDDGLDPVADPTPPPTMDAAEVALATEDDNAVVVTAAAQPRHDGADVTKTLPIPPATPPPPRFDHGA
jgi:hypothetical protein